MADPFGRHWGYETSKAADVRPGVLYPILHRMLERGLLVDGWEDSGEIAGRRQPRRYYALTDEGRLELGAVQVAVPTNAVGTRLPGRFAL